NKYYPYWHQKETLYRTLPNSANEIIFLGNSITDGCNWSELLGEPRAINRGISGDRTEGILDRLDEVLDSKPLKVFLMIGINDLGGGKSVNYVKKNIVKIVERIKNESPSTEIYLQSILPVNPDFGLFKTHTDKTKEVIKINKYLKNYCGNNNMNYVDLHSSFITEKNYLNPEFTNDGLHLIGKGYLLWKSLIIKNVKN
ncbi:GDSL-type esterase/lipase family protein, partial [Bacteroidota bacterium]